MDMPMDRSAIKAYVIDFFRHLRRAEDHRRDFEIFYPLWLRVRLGTLEELRELLRSLESGEFVCDVGSATGSSVGILGSLGQLATFIATGAINPVGIAVQCAGHGLKSGMSAGKAVILSRARERIRQLMIRDYAETRGFVEMGLEFDGIFREMRETIENIRRMSLRYTVDELMEEIGTINPGQGAIGPPTREIARALIEGGNNIAQIDANNVAEILSRCVRNNPDVLRAVQAAGQAGFDLLGLTRLMRVQIIGNWGFQHLYIAGAMVSMGMDVRDLSQAIVRLASGSSVTQDMVRSVIERLEKEQEWLTQVYNRLSK